MGRVIADAKLADDDCRDPFGRPHVSDKAVRFRSLRQQCRQLRPLLGGQPNAPAWRLAVIQRRAASLPCPLQPLAHRAARHPERLRNPCPPPALLMQRQRTQAPPFCSAPDFLDRMAA